MDQGRGELPKPTWINEIYIEPAIIYRSIFRNLKATAVIPTIANAHLINQPRLGLRSIFWVWRLCSGSLSGSAESILAFTIQRTYSLAGV